MSSLSALLYDLSLCKYMHELETYTLHTHKISDGNSIKLMVLQHDIYEALTDDKEMCSYVDIESLLIIIQ